MGQISTGLEHLIAIARSTDGQERVKKKNLKRSERMRKVAVDTTLERSLKRQSFLGASAAEKAEMSQQKIVSSFFILHS